LTAWVIGRTKKKPVAGCACCGLLLLMEAMMTAKGAGGLSIRARRVEDIDVVHRTRLQLGDAYEFAWTPTTPEQGAPA
jgi:hypothetical protein